MFAAAEILETIVAPCTDLQFVLSTSWVRVLTYYKAAKRLPPDLRGRLRGATWLSNMNLDWWNTLTRYEQIATHVSRHAITRWLSIDKDDEGWPLSESHHLVRTNDSTGLLERAAQHDLQRKLELLCSVWMFCTHIVSNGNLVELERAPHEYSRNSRPSGSHCGNCRV